MSTFEEKVAAAKEWFENRRFEGIVRLYFPFGTVLQIRLKQNSFQESRRQPANSIVTQRYTLGAIRNRAKPMQLQGTAMVPRMTEKIARPLRGSLRNSVVMPRTMPIAPARLPIKG